MSNDDDKKIKGIADLLAEAKKKNGKDIKVSSNETQEKFEKKVKEIDVKAKEKEAANLAASLGYPYINLVAFPISDKGLEAISEDSAKKEKIICFYLDDENARLAVIDPKNPAVAENIERIKTDFFVKNVAVYMTSEHSFSEAFKLYARLPKLRKISSGIEITGEELERLKSEVKNFGLLNAKVNEEKSMTRIINLILAGGLQSRASDIHIESEEKDVIIRYRIDGHLHIAAKMPKEMWKPLDSRIKGVAGLKINVTDVPQDGRITVMLNTGKLDIRVSALPTAYGESIVMRLLGYQAAELKFEDLGLRGSSYDNLKKQIERPIGMIITTGPTGSGKTTTLYAILNKLNNEDTKIITLEDPIEYKLAGIAQSQVEHEKGYGFADGLRSILRQDPDVIMVGELRDLETAETAIQAALTGHKVVSTLHTNDAAGAIPRFISMGVKPFLLAPALNAAIGQRLVRRIHDKCKIEQQLEPEELDRVKKIIEELPPEEKKKVDLTKLKFYRGQGCDECNHIGYKGRVGIYEVLTMNEGIEKEILGGQVSEYKMRDLAKAEGMVTMVQDGILKALDAMTTVEEVFAVATET